MKLDPEERIIATALDQAQLDDAKERRVGGAGQGARFDNCRALRRSDPAGRPWRVRFSRSTSRAVELTDRSPLACEAPVDFMPAVLEAEKPVPPTEHGEGPSVAARVYHFQAAENAENAVIPGRGLCPRARNPATPALDVNGLASVHVGVDGPLPH